MRIPPIAEIFVYLVIIMLAAFLLIVAWRLIGCLGIRACRIGFS